MGDIGQEGVKERGVDIYMKMFRKDEGFTLVELMVVVLIIGILVAIAIPVFLNASANAQLKSCQASQRTIEGAIQTYNSTDAGVTTPYVDGLVDSGSKIIGTSIKSIPYCPSGDKSTMFYETAGGVVVGDISKAVGDKAWFDAGKSTAHKHF